ncbi:uncharacterized protein EHS24_005348 [Apiotrichum porosum]|uniref:Uncharacterized protein n=1 Tax=Apiotrichum porosum TaxID=105984 RepID=A0A427XCY0_9TREE|nr:uncharacterized protein EHS24_005348 [Apiotrichum porosum]RSH76770.1 hypothetical protein EHS24_005348 [Apiotrichum porosum]
MGRTGRGPFPLPSAGDTDSRTPYQSTYNLLMTMSVKSPKGRCAQCVVRGRPCYTLPADVDGPRTCTECFRHGRDCCFDEETAATDEQTTVDQEVAVEEGSPSPAESSVASSPEPEPQPQPRQLPWLATPPTHIVNAHDFRHLNTYYPVHVQPASTLNDDLQRAALQSAALETAQRQAAAQQALASGIPPPVPTVSPRRRRRGAESEPEPQRRMYHPLFVPGLHAPSPIPPTAATVPALPGHGQSAGGYEGPQRWRAHIAGAPHPTTSAVAANAAPQMYTPQMYYYVVANTAPYDPAEQHRTHRRRHDTGVTVGTPGDSGEVPSGAPSASQQTRNVDLSRFGNHDFGNADDFQRGVFRFAAPRSSSSVQPSAMSPWQPSVASSLRPSSSSSSSALSTSSSSMVTPPDWNMDDLPPAATTRVWYTSTYRPSDRSDGSGSPTPDEET